MNTALVWGWVSLCSSCTPLLTLSLQPCLRFLPRRRLSQQHFGSLKTIMKRASFVLKQMLSPHCSGSVSVGNARGHCSQPADAPQAPEMFNKYPVLNLLLRAATAAPEDQKLF